MGKIYKSVTELVGRTPLLEVQNIEEQLQLGAKVRLAPSICTKLRKSGENRTIFPTFNACGRVIVARGGNPDGSPSHSPSLRYTFFDSLQRRRGRNNRGGASFHRRNAVEKW